MFPQFEPTLNSVNLQKWNDSIFVFDTNCLLNLYRYRAETRDQLLNIIDNLSDRIWIPHHVALEFNKNRLKVILSQKKRFSEIKDVLISSQNKLRAEIDNLQLERRHSLIDPSPVTKGFKDLIDRFLNDLTNLQKDQQPITGHDPIKEKIDSLFEGKVGDAPSNQKEIDDLFKEAEKRYSFKIPPGYMDSKKDKTDTDEYYNSGIIYKRKYGDFVIWSQLIKHAKEKDIKSVIFVTDDGKEDWWWIINDESPKTLGPRPELIDEAKHAGGITSFLMYKPQGFLENSLKFVNAKVSKEAIDEVRDVSRLINNSKNDSVAHLYNMTRRAQKGVYNWLKQRFYSVTTNEDGAPDFVATSLGETIGFEVIFTRKPHISRSRRKENSLLIYGREKIRKISKFTVVWVVENLEMASHASLSLSAENTSDYHEDISHIIGFIEDVDGEPIFMPVYGSYPDNGFEDDIFG